MREDEMKTKECPNKFLSASLCVSMTREDKSMTAEDFVRIMDSTHCIGSDCAMWAATDNECRPQNGAEEADCFPAGHCGLIK